MTDYCKRCGLKRPVELDKDKEGEKCPECGRVIDAKPVVQEEKAEQGLKCPLGGDVKLSFGVEWCLTHACPVSECEQEKMESDRETGAYKEG